MMYSKLIQKINSYDYLLYGDTRHKAMLKRHKLRKKRKKRIKPTNKNK